MGKAHVWQGTGKPGLKTIAGLAVTSLCWAASAGQETLKERTLTIGDPDNLSVWTPNVDRGKTAIELGADSARVKKGPKALKVTIKTDGDGQEDYPKLSRPFEGPNDWTGYHKVECWVYCECADRNVSAQDFAIVFYPRRRFAQQCVHHSVPINQWVLIRDWLTSYERDDVSRDDLYLYETAADAPHGYTWWIEGLKLVGLKEGIVPWDQGVLELAPKSPSPRPGPAKATLRTSEGLSLSFDAAGRVVSLNLDGKDLAPRRQEFHSGLLLKVAGEDTRLVPVGGKLSTSGGSIVQVAQQEGFALEAKYARAKDGIEVECKLTNLRAAEDRGVSVYFALPLSGSDWTWWDDTVRSRGMEGKQELYNVIRDQAFGANGSHSHYPLAAVGNSTTGTGLALALRMDEPRLHRFAYNPVTKQLYVAFDLGLTAATKKFPNQAWFRFYLYRIDGKWGMRSAAEKYYRLFPEFFVKRVAKDGGWTVWGSASKLEKAEDFGYAYDWGPTAEAARWDKDQGLYTFHYLEAEFHQHPMSDFDRLPTRKECLDRLAWVADPSRKEPLPKLSYYECGCGNIDASAIAGRVDEFNRLLAQATMKSGIRDEKEELQFAVGPAPWVGDKGWRAHFFCSLDPEIPGGRGQFDFDQYLATGFDRWKKLGIRIDGVGFDSFNGFGVNSLGDWDKGHFAYADIPLTFAATGYKPVMPMAFSTYEWTLELARRLRAEGKLMIANWWSHYPFSAHLFDILGSESARFYPDPWWARFVAYHKPCSDLPYEARDEAWVKEHMLLAIFPGERGRRELYAKYVPVIRRLAGAGWEPVTHARTDCAEVLVERFGPGGSGEVFFSLQNPAKKSKQVTLNIDIKALGFSSKTLTVTDLVRGEPLPAATKGENLALTINMPAGDTTALGIGPQRTK